MTTRLAVVWLVLLVLGAAIVAGEWSGGAGSEHTGDGHGDSAPRMLLPAPLEQLSAIEVGYEGTLHRFERDAAGTWFYHGVHTGAEQEHEHQADAQSAQRIDKALTALGRTRIERQFALSGDGPDYGVAVPGMLILVYAPDQSQPLAQYAVGDVAPDGLSRYVLPLGSPAVVTIPDYQIENLLALLQAVGSEQEQAGASPGAALLRSGQ